MTTDLALPAVVTMTTTGLHIPEGISREDWESVGEFLGQIDKRMQWMVGDWINAGEREGYINSETYDDAERLFPQFKRKTLWEYASVARNSSMRMEELSFNHHQVVAALEPEVNAAPGTPTPGAAPRARVPTSAKFLSVRRTSAARSGRSR